MNSKTRNEMLHEPLMISRESPRIWKQIMFHLSCVVYSKSNIRHAFILLRPSSWNLNFEVGDFFYLDQRNMARLVVLKWGRWHVLSSLQSFLWWWGQNLEQWRLYLGCGAGCSGRSSFPSLFSFGGFNMQASTERALGSLFQSCMLFQMHFYYSPPFFTFHQLLW
jgi:hypothetical protein